jgi:hypothetical protein
VIAMIALFVALTGTSYAAVTISASQIKNNSIPGSKLKANSVPATKLKNNSITGTKMKNNTVGRAKLRTDALNPVVGGGNVQTQSSDDETKAGARGPQGPSGPRGLTGTTGAKGEPGAPGAQGGQAAAGDSQFVAVTASDTVDETGAATAAVNCADGQVLYGANYATNSLVPATAEPLNGDTTYSVSISGGALGEVLNVYGMCGPA